MTDLSTGATQTRPDLSKSTGANRLTDPKAAWKIPDPREYMKIKYSAPTGACKCGECQLVPPEMLMVWSAEIESLRAQVKQLRIVRP